MAKFLTTNGNSYFIEQIILNAERNLTLVTPYLRLSKNFIDRLADADKEGIRITLIYGKDEISKSEKDKLKKLENLEVYFCQNLHAKCYHNENSMIITSMNLYEFSEKNNREMGIFVERDKDSQIFNETLKEITSIKNASIQEKAFIENNTKKDSSYYLKMNPDFQEHWNFHLPSLYEILNNKYPDYKINLEDHITISNFPEQNIELVVSGRIDFKFSDSFTQMEIKNKCENSLKRRLPKFRFFWNRNQLNIYEEKGFSVNIDEEGLKSKIDKSIEIIDTVYDEIKNKK